MRAKRFYNGEKRRKNTAEILDVLKQGRKVGRKQKLSLGFMIFGRNMIGVIYNLYLLKYYINFMGLAIELFILANIIFLIWNTLNDFLFGMYADRTKHRLGRRIPYLRYGAIFIVLTFPFFFISVPGATMGDLGGQAIIFTQLLIALLVYDTVTTILGISLNALMVELTESTNERTNLSVYDRIFNALGGLGIIFVPMLFQAGLDIFRIFVVIMSLFTTLFYFIGSYLIKEREGLHDISESKPTEIKKALKDIFKSKIFWVNVVYSFCFSYLVGNIMQFGGIMGYVLGWNNAEMIINGIFYLGAYPGYFAFQYLAKKVEIDNIVIKTAYIFLTLIIPLFIFDILFNVPLVYLIIIYSSGILFSLSIFSFVFFNDVVDFDELNTNERREAKYGAIQGLIIVPIPQIVTIIGLSVLNVFNYQESVNNYALQSPEAIFGIKLLIAVLPIILAIVIILNRRYNTLKGEKLVELRKSILDLHAQKEKEYKQRNGI